MYCEVCGAHAQGIARCPECRATAASVWILAMAGLGWAASLALLLVVGIELIGNVQHMWARLGATLPFSVRLHLALGRWLFPVVAPLAMAAPIIIGIAGRRAPARFLTWTRRYASTAVLGLAWALMGVYQWYVAMTSLITHLG
jgi:hypothetical protein